ncbi:MAG: OmpA family protein [Bacteroidota bacterium]|nr:OmpA family protein [Bacteroidota bacterium]MDP4234190.1 OmpA family protein [Bacteroidota bacterium]MDP4243744.1 OmpA family protein [Bacteroidota bacterium]MDP4287891.1 OmpA family protein [Bacteroidota bacterium]
MLRPIFVSVLCLLAGIAHGQTTAGKEFWFGFMYNDSGVRNPIELSVYVSSPTHTNGTLRVPGAGFEQSFSVEPGVGTVIHVPSGIGMVRTSEQIEQRAIHIESESIVACFALNYSAQTADASVILPAKALGREYRVMAYTPAGYPSECMVVATMDSTQIEITPTAPTLAGHKADLPFTIILSRGEEYQVQSNGDLTGTRIIASRPVAVFGGSSCASIPPGTDFSDHLYEQMYPLSAWGKNFITIPLKTRKGDTYRILASEDSTRVGIGKTFQMLNAGKFYECVLREPTSIRASKSIAVAQYSNSTEYDHVEDADPFMILLSPNEQMQTGVTFNAFASKVITAYYLNVLVPASGRSVLRLDGRPVVLNRVTIDPNYYYGQLDISAGDHTLGCDNGFVAYVYGYGHAESYGYSAGASIKAIEHYAMVRGRALDKKTQKPIAAKIVYDVLPEGRPAGVVNTDPTTGAYNAILSSGAQYGIRAEAPGYYAISDNLDARDTTDDLQVTRDLELAPIEVGQVVRLNNVFFDLNEAILRPESFPELDRVVKLLKENPDLAIAVGGHTDNTGLEDKNMQLSIDRAAAVCAYITHAGITETRVSAKGFGDTKPIGSNDTDDGRRQNRRVEFAIVK